jgi:hypothetical protein
VKKFEIIRNGERHGVIGLKGARGFECGFALCQPGL